MLVCPKIICSSNIFTPSGLQSFRLNGQTTFVESESKEIYFKLNPRIFWRGMEAPDKKMVAEFDMIDKNRKKRKINN